MEQNPKQSRRDELASLVYDHIQQSRYRPVKPRVIAKQLGLDIDDTRQLRIVVKQLVKQGLAKYGPRHIVIPGSGQPDISNDKSEVITDTPPESDAPDTDESAADTDAPPDGPTDAPSDGTITGKFQRNSGGFGFVRPLGTPSDVGTEHDLFVPREQTLGAATGDIVRVRRMRSRRHGGRGESDRAEVIEIKERKTSRFVGTYGETKRRGFVRVDGRQFEDPVSVGDPGAKGARTGDKVVIEMVRFPDTHDAGEAVLVDVLGARGEPGVDTLSIIHEFGLIEEFPESAMQEARRQAELFDPEKVPEGRRDLTADTVVTIDPVDARDFDDAISLELLASGNWSLSVHIADVSHFVEEGSPLDDEAYRRATSVYLPDRVIPMLPEIISNNLASLQPDKRRYARTAIMEVSPDGTVLHTEVTRSVIKSDRRFAYEEIDDFLQNRSAWREKLTEDVYLLLDHMYTLAMILRRRRIEEGALEMGLPEIKIDLDRQGRVSGAHHVINTESHQIIEEFMLLANRSVAEQLHLDELKFLRRIHGAPSPRKLESLSRLLKELKVTDSGVRSRFDIKSVIKAVEDKPEEQCVNLAVLRSMQKAVYGPEEEGHYALSFAHYCHFTSPIRRYPDLTVHRMFDDLQDNKRPPQDFAVLQSQGEHCSDRERNAESAERELIKLKLLNYMKDQVGEELVAVVTGVEEYGLFVQGVKIPAEGLISVRSMRDDHYKLDRDARRLAGFRSGNAFGLGDTLVVTVSSVDMQRRELNFSYVRTLQSHTPQGKPVEGSGGGGGRRGARGPRKRGSIKQAARRSGGKRKRGRRRRG
ncbi:MAG: ribonuclease R [Rhodopirellula sp.]|nr:ribonuclease R [Rhodopirellula sp.]MCH2360583.1 ribonuclease R [Pirellulales bacterium]